ncbi:MAG: hypothetical protein AAGI12_08070 [Pseudomonadota bacterium]
MNSPESGLWALWSQIGQNIQVLFVAGGLGALAKALVAPEGRWWARIVQAVGGLIFAFCLGPIVANFLTPYAGEEIWAWLAAGFLCGFAGESSVTILQNKLMGGRK